MYRESFPQLSSPVLICNHLRIVYAWLRSSRRPSTDPRYFWPMFPLLGQGIGLAAHAWDVYRSDVPSEERIRREMERLRGRLLVLVDFHRDVHSGNQVEILRIGNCDLYRYPLGKLLETSGGVVLGNGR